MLTFTVNVLMGLWKSLAKWAQRITIGSSDIPNTAGQGRA